jgi:acetyltransferase-like isoleucine patch superfamily enzyme
MNIREFLSKIISSIKKEEWSFSENISITYLFFFFIEKLFSLIRGFYFFPFSFKIIFVGKRTIIKGRNLFKFGENLQISNGCYIDTLSLKGIYLGNNVSIGKYTTIECSGSLKNLGIGLTVGDYSSLGTHGYFGCAGGISIGSNTIPV